MASQFGLMPWVTPRFWDDVDPTKPLSNGKIYFYTAGTTDIKTVFTDSAGTIPYPSPIELDAAGKAPGLIWLESGTYDLQIKDKNDSLQWTAEGIESSSGGASDFVKVNSRQEVRGLDTDANSNSLVFVAGDYSAGGSENRSYFFDEDNIQDDNDDTVLSPDPSPLEGRWVTFTPLDIISSIEEIETDIQSIEGQLTIVDNRTEFVNTGFSTVQLLSEIRELADEVETVSYYDGGVFGGAKWLKTGGAGTAGETDYQNGLLYDGNGDERVILNIEITPGMFGGASDGATNDAAAIQAAFDYAALVKFDRIYYTLETLILPGNNTGRILEGVNSETSGIETLEGFAGEEQEIESGVVNAPNAIFVSVLDHGLTAGDSVFIYGADKDQINGYYDQVDVYSTNAFGVPNLMIFPEGYISETITGQVSFRKCKSILKTNDSGTYDKITIKNLIIDGASSISAGAGSAVDFRYNVAMGSARGSLTKAKFNNVTLKAYGGPGARLSDIFAGDFERVFAYSDLYHAIYIDDPSGSSTFRNCNIIKAGKSKAGIYSLKDVSIEALSMADNSAGAAYAVYAGSTTENGDAEDYAAKVSIKDCNLEGFFFSYLAFPFHPSGEIAGNSFTLLTNDTKSFIYSGDAAPDKDTTISLNANKYNLIDTFSVSIDRFVVENITEIPFVKDLAEMYTAIDEKDTNKYTVIEGTEIGEKAFTSMQGSYINNSIPKDNLVGKEIEALGKDFIKVTTGGIKDTINGKEIGDRLRVMADVPIVLNHLKVPATGIVQGNICMKSMNDVTMEAGRIYEFEKRGDYHYQIDDTNPGNFSLTIPNDSSALVAGPIPDEVATYIVSDQVGIHETKTWEVRQSGGPGLSNITILEGPSSYTGIAEYTLTAELNDGFYFLRFAASNTDFGLSHTVRLRITKQ